jgi:small subunit ribosomal protein S14
MATTAKVAKEIKPAKFKIRLRHRCQRCGRPRAYMRKFACAVCASASWRSKGTSPE